MRVAMGILQNLRERFRSRQQGDASRSQGDASRSLQDELRGRIKRDVSTAFEEVLKPLTNSPFLDFQLIPSKPGKEGLGMGEGAWIVKLGQTFKILEGRGYPRLSEAVEGPKTHNKRLTATVLDITDILEKKAKPKKSDDQIA
jgi:hypothetical protein